MHRSGDHFTLQSFVVTGAAGPERHRGRSAESAIHAAITINALGAPLAPQHRSTGACGFQSLSSPTNVANSSTFIRSGVKVFTFSCGSGYPSAIPHTTV